MERRDFLKTAIAASVPVAAGGILESLATALRADEPQPGRSAQPNETMKGEMIYRQLGKTGERVSVIGLGGFHIGMQGDEQESIRIIRQAVDHGINFMDNSWDYNAGASEIRMGKALQDGYRDKVFLMTKINGRTKQAAAGQIDESLKRLKTDRIDLLQHHEVIRLEDPDRIFAPGSAHEAMLDARKAGKIRFIGFTGHKDPLVHLRMLEMADKHDFRFDAVQMPLSVMDAHFRSFEKKVLPVLVKNEIGVLGHEIDGLRRYPPQQRGKTRRVPALRHEPAHLNGHNGHRQPGNPAPGFRRSARLQTAHFRGSRLALGAHPPKPPPKAGLNPSKPAACSTARPTTRAGSADNRLRFRDNRSPPPPRPQLAPVLPHPALAYAVLSHPPPTTHRSPSTFRRPPPTLSCSPFTVHRKLPTVYSPISANQRSQAVIHFPAAGRHHRPYVLQNSSDSSRFRQSLASICAISFPIEATSRIRESP